MTSGLMACAAAAACLAADTQSAPPRRWTPAAISTDRYEAAPSFSPDGRELVYLSADRSFGRWKLLMSRCEDGRWTPPQSPPFAAREPVIEADPGYTPDGRGLYFVSARHDPANEDFDIWHVARGADGRWGEPERLPPPVNSPHSELLPRVDGAGTLYFGSSRPGGFGQGDIYQARRDRHGAWQVTNVGPPVSTAANEYEAEVSRDGDVLIVVADRGERSHLYRFRHGSGGWVEAGEVRADPSVFQVGPLLAPDGGSLLFAQSDGARSGEIFGTDLRPGGSPGWPRPCGRPE